MASRALSKQSTEPAEPDRTALPLWDGTQLSGLPWLRELEANEHLLDADVSYFLRTGAVVTSAAKTAVSSAEHSALLKNSIIIKQNYSVRNPPPDDNFIKLYAEVQGKISSGEPPFTGEAIKTALPKIPPSQLPETYVLSPDRIMVADLKLRNVLLSLITSRGRKVHYQQLTQSGITLLHQLIEDTKPNAGYYTQSPYTLQLKAQLAQLLKINLSCPSQTEFDQIRDSIDEVNNQLEEEDRLTSNQLCDHYLKLISHSNLHRYGFLYRSSFALTQWLMGTFQGPLLALLECLLRSSHMNNHSLTKAMISLQGPYQPWMPTNPIKTQSKLGWPRKEFQKLHAHFARRCIGNNSVSKTPAQTKTL